MLSPVSDVQLNTRHNLFFIAGGRRGAALLIAAGVKKASKEKLVNFQETRSVALASRMPRLDRGLISDPITSQPLPPKLSALKDIFIAIQTVYDVLRRRNKRPTFSNLKPAVEEVSGHRFVQEHLQQLAALVPEAITLEISQGSGRMRSRCQKALAWDPVVLLAPSTPDQPLSSLRSLVHERLAEHLIRSYRAHLKNEASKKRKIGSLKESKELIDELEALHPPVLDFRLPYPEAVPDVGARDSEQPSCTSNSIGSFYSSPCAVTSCNISAAVSAASCDGMASGVICGNGGHAGSDCSNDVVPLTEAELRQPGPRRLSFAPSIEVVAEKARKEAACKSDEDILAMAPEALRRRSLDGIVSLEALRALEGNEAVHRRLSTQEAHEFREISVVVASLPQIFSRVRRIFGTRGPSAMKFDEVVQRLQDGSTEEMTAGRARECLHALAEHAPEFLELKPWGSCGTPAVWINRRCKTNPIVSRLREIADSRPKLV